MTIIAASMEINSRFRSFSRHVWRNGVTFPIDLRKPLLFHSLFVDVRAALRSSLMRIAANTRQKSDFQTSISGLIKWSSKIPISGVVKIE